MFVVLVAIIVLIASVGAIYLLLKNMGQDGVEVAAPGSCKRGRCGISHGSPAAAESYGQEEASAGETDESTRHDALPPKVA